MTAIRVSHLAPRGCWDETLVDDLLNNRLFDTGLEFEHVDGWAHQKHGGTVVVIPGQYWWEKIDDIREALIRYQWALCIRTADEEDLFSPAAASSLSNVKWWIQTPKTSMGAYPVDHRFIPVGYTPHFRRPPVTADKTIDLFFSGQDNHRRRHEALAAMRAMQGEYLRGRVQVTGTESFTAGMDPEEYMARTCEAKIIPCPSGIASVDSFRVCEALQAQATPIADHVSPRADHGFRGMLEMVFEGEHFPILTDWAQLKGYTEDQLERWPANNNRIAAWWLRWKRRLCLNLVADLRELGALENGSGIISGSKSL